MLLEDFLLPSLSFRLLSKFIKRKIDAIKYAQTLKKYGKISEDICLLFDKTYLQIVRSIGSNESGEWDKGIVCLMIEGMKESISYDEIISRNSNASWLRDELFECLDAQIES